jgi:hypothetical protein
MFICTRRFVKVPCYVERAVATMRKCEVVTRACEVEEVGGGVVAKMSRWWLVATVDSAAGKSRGGC